MADEEPPKEFEEKMESAEDGDPPAAKKDDRRDDDEDDRRSDKKGRDDSRSPSRDNKREKKGRDESRSRSKSRSRSRSKSRSRSRSRRKASRGRDRSRSPEDETEKARKFGDDTYGRKLYVGNLDFRTDKDYLQDKFEKYGTITDVFVPCDGRGDPRGFAFITFEKKRDAEDAVDAMHDSRLDGRRITCNIARPRPPLRDGGRRGGGGGRGGSRSPRGGGGGSSRSCKIYVGNLPMDVREREVEDIYGKFGPIVRIDLKTPSRPPAYAFVEFEDERDAEDAMRDTNGMKFGREYLRVEFSRSTRR
mmetsp:Transcript_7051/g.9793  ORF Transcript_7051/g.9793 Transcript_7051/m.9793 type:complete len:305 (-) Transcript_7051:133-1047(-)|eukprot:CAMPEP_0184489676 /NCGR_PEP_ID=MMETSP0113_2-20130426/16104_1 /TAXON_ID=91329 /ORGANISM="Norrisiella sphaerica, Strain BC52" /LENGTH=304 /DNA_ID=CAMNT_0026873239 /DNA_START=452 /DNA_END=1366 /DNA_ORIENTATION=+